ncbi:Membrane protein involved in aromatic hydrocarbon degradation [Candidatus Magnetomorum sp. HK-1]|nr:Membrane protein involved in aromatic hydrocarbon degradation [Candidatus Magnetomorum sp. HK-1]
MIRSTQIILMIIILFPYYAFSLPSSSDYNVPSSYQPIGSGARAIGMGGAFIGVADDATAASWNPGGLVQLEKSEVSIVGTFLRRKEDISLNESTLFLEPQTVNLDSLNYFSLSYCFTFLQRNMVVSLNYQNLYDFNREWRFPVPVSLENASIDMNIDFVSEGKISAIGLAYSLEIHPKFSLGITFNYWEDNFSRNTWETTSTSNTRIKTETMAQNTFKESRYTYQMDNGFNTNIGFLWHITPSLSLGGVYKARFTADLSQKSTTQDITSIIFHDKPDLNSETETIKTKKSQNELKMPMSYGLGLACKITNLWTLSLDIYRTEWDEFILKTSEGEFSPLFALPTDDSSLIPSTIPTIKPTHQIRLGSEYLVINKQQQTIVPFRAGIFYDPVPGKGSPENLWGFSIGTGFSKSPYNFDIAFQYRRGSSFGEDYNLKTIQSYDISEAILYTSLIYHF